MPSIIPDGRSDPGTSRNSMTPACVADMDPTLQPLQVYPVQAVTVPTLALRLPRDPRIAPKRVLQTRLQASLHFIFMVEYQHEPNVRITENSPIHPCLQAPAYKIQSSLLSRGHLGSAGSALGQSTAPLISAEALEQTSADACPALNLFGTALNQRGRDLPEKPTADSRLFLNMNTPSSTMICGMSFCRIFTRRH